MGIKKGSAKKKDPGIKVRGPLIILNAEPFQVLL